MLPEGPKDPPQLVRQQRLVARVCWNGRPCIGCFLGSVLLTWLLDTQNPGPPHLPHCPQVEAIMKLFDRWARLLEEAPQEKVHAPFVTELQAAGFLKVWGRGRREGGRCQPVAGCC